MPTMPLHSSRDDSAISGIHCRRNSPQHVFRESEACLNSLVLVQYVLSEKARGPRCELPALKR